MYFQVICESGIVFSPLPLFFLILLSCHCLRGFGLQVAALLLPHRLLGSVPRATPRPPLSVFFPIFYSACSLVLRPAESRIAGRSEDFLSDLFFFDRLTALRTCVFRVLMDFCWSIPSPTIFLRAEYPVKRRSDPRRGQCSPSSCFSFLALSTG